MCDYVVIGLLGLLVGTRNENDYDFGSGCFIVVLDAYFVYSKFWFRWKNGKYSVLEFAVGQANDFGTFSFIQLSSSMNDFCGSGEFGSCLPLYMLSPLLFTSSLKVFHNLPDLGMPLLFETYFDQ